MSLESTTSKIAGRVGDDSGLGATLKFDLGDDGVIHIDGASNPNAVSNDDKDADCTVSMSLGDLEALIAGELDPTVAFMAGKLRVSGDMGVAMKLGNLVK